MLSGRAGGERQKLNGKQGHFRQCFVHGVLDIDRVGGKGRPEWGMFEPVWKEWEGSKPCGGSEKRGQLRQRHRSRDRDRLGVFKDQREALSGWGQVSKDEFNNVKLEWESNVRSFRAL